MKYPLIEKWLGLSVLSSSELIQAIDIELALAKGTQLYYKEGRPGFDYEPNDNTITALLVGHQSINPELINPTRLLSLIKNKIANGETERQEAIIRMVSECIKESITPNNG